ncbi:GNAT family N-acetyltransferase [Sandarakinorhabdus sp. DWP1-3-1]|uniref:GNAT family N-acetyltransferase n=1 Tax=Sandarakinorhabdus sp. DWP1-3-1 TaxID=2804627 RepID=UPI003CEE3237
MIRAATPADAAAIAAIYAPEVLRGTATFETEAPDLAAMAARIARVVAADWPWLVATHGGGIVGYAYAMQFRDRPAYARTCENTIYVAADQHRTGVGRALLTALCSAAHGAGFDQMIAVIGDGVANVGSIGLHAACGFREAGRLVDVGLKFGRRLDVVYMQRSLG